MDPYYPTGDKQGIAAPGGASDVAARPLRGRAAEVGRLEQQVQALAAGRGGVVLVEGLAGLGKSHLLHRARQTAANGGVAMAAATAAWPERLVPLTPLLDALDVALGTAPSGLTDKRLWLLDQLRTRLVERTVVEPLLLVLDDLQWADPVTLFAVRNLASQLESYALLWLLAGRRGAAGSPFDLFSEQLEQLPWVERVELHALSSEAAAEVVGDIAGGVPQPELLGLAGHAGGNPFLLVELVEGLEAAGAIEVVEGRAGLVYARVPSPLPPIAALRLDRLATDARELLEVGAMFGATFSLEDVAEVLIEPVGRLLPAMRQALDLGVVVAGGQTLGFRHELVHRAVYDELPEAIRVALHREIGLLLLRRGGSALRAAPHLMHAAKPGDREALSGLDQAAEEARGWWPPMAADFALQTLVLTQPGAEDRFGRTVTTIDALEAGGRLDKAIELARASLKPGQFRPRDDAQLRIRLSRMLFMSGHTDDALALAEAVLHQPDLPDPLFTEAELARLRCLTAQDDFQAARQPAEAILAGGERPGVDAALGAAVATLGLIAWNEGHVADALGHLRAAVQRADRTPVHAPRIYPNLLLGVALTAIGRFDEAQAVMRESQEVIERRRGRPQRPSGPTCGAVFESTRNRATLPVRPAPRMVSRERTTWVVVVPTSIPTLSRSRLSWAIATSPPRG